MDFFPSQHSASCHWTTDQSVEHVVAALRRVIEDSTTTENTNGQLENTRWMTSSERLTFLGRGSSDVSTTPTGDVVFHFLRTSGAMGFRDLKTFVISKRHTNAKSDTSEQLKQETGQWSTHVQATGRSIDYHVYTVCPCCAGTLCRYVACFFCCCGIIPTQDWGQNEETLNRIASTMKRNNNINLILVGSESTGLCDKESELYTAPPVVDGER